MPSVGPWEIILVLIVALLVFGPKRLPEMGKSVGKGMREFKDSLAGTGKDDDDDTKDSVVASTTVQELPPAAPPPAGTAPTVTTHRPEGGTPR